MDKEEFRKRTKEFAKRCIKLVLSLPNSIIGRHLQDQLIRASTSVAANYRAACLAQSKAGFTAKLSIEIEEVDESLFWLEFILINLKQLILKQVQNQVYVKSKKKIRIN